MNILNFSEFSKLNESADVWTDELKKKAVKYLTDVESDSMGKPVKVLLKNIKFLSNGTARYVGKAANYTFEPSDVE